MISISQDTTDGSDRLGRKRKLLLVSVVALVVVGLGAGFVVADDVETQSWEDDFSDGNADGWQNADSETPDVTEDGPDGEYTMRVTMDDDSTTEWLAGPTLNVSEEFTVRGTVKSDQADGDVRTRLGVFTDQREGALLVFSDEYDSTFLTTHATDGEPGDDALDTDFDDEWVNFELHMDGDGTVYAKVWEISETEPVEYQMDKEFDGVTGSFALEPGTSEANRVMWLNEVSIEGVEELDEDLDIDTRSFIRHGATADYDVTDTFFDDELEENVTVDVTDEADVTSLDTDGITVDEDNQTLIATNDTDYNDVVTIQADYEGRTTQTDVTVAEVEVEHLEILPGIWRFAALMGDITIQVLLITVGAGVVAARASTAFAGLGAMQLTLTIGWFGGWIPTGIALVGLFAALFIGFNLAANIDYAVR